MDDQNRRPEAAPAEDDEEFVRGLLESAGPRQEIPDEDLQAISMAARSVWQEQTRTRSRARFVRPALTMAAVLAALAIGLSFWWSMREVVPAIPGASVVAVAGQVTVEVEGSEPRAIGTGDSIPVGAALTAATGRTSLRLPNSTIVRLDIGARIRLIAPQILELEQGALYADTGGQAGNRIEVRTQVGTAHDIGTQFVVRLANQGAPELHVLVREGSVAVEQGGRSLVASAGRELVIGAKGTPQLRDAPRYGAEWEWIMDTAGGFDVEGRSLQEFLDWVTRETGWSVRYENDELASSSPGIILHGGIGELRPDKAPFVVLPSAGLEGEMREGTLLIRRAR